MTERSTIFIGVLWGASLLFELLGLLVQPFSWLVGGIIAIVLMFFIPDKSGKARDLETLIVMLLGLAGFFVISVKFRPWLDVQVGYPLAGFASFLLMLVVVAGLLVLSIYWNNNVGNERPE